MKNATLHREVNHISMQNVGGNTIILDFINQKLTSSSTLEN